MPEINEKDIIWITDAVEEYHRNRNTLEALIDKRKLSVVKIEADRKIYLLRSELDALFSPRVVRPADAQQDAG